MFVLLIVSFAVQRLFSLIRSHLSIFCFVSISFSILIIKSLTISMSKIVCSRLSSRIFIGSSFTFKSFFHTELIFVYRVRKGPNVSLLHVVTQLPQHHLFNSVSFPHCLFLSALSKNMVLPYFIYFSVLFHWSVSFCMSIMLFCLL